MNSRKYHLHDGKNGAALAIRVTSGAMKNAVVGVLDDGTVKIQLKSPIKGGDANQVLVEYLAEILEIQWAQIEIVAGESGRDKLVSLLDLDAGTVQRRIIKNIK